MTSTGEAAGVSRWRRAPAARVLHATTATLVTAALVLQVVVVVRDGVRPVGARLLDLAGSFTIQSNLLVAFTAVTLALRADRDGPVWRVARLDALLGITVTGLVSVMVLAPVHDLGGAPAVADAGLHYLSPVLVCFGWYVYGPRHRVELWTWLWALVWPAAYFAYTLVHGAISGWYPYPFVDVGVHGYKNVLGSSALVTLLLLGFGAVYWWGDRRMPSAPTPAIPASGIPAGS